MIDWTKPLEHIDGTPVRLAKPSEITSITRNPDAQGDYYLVREDGLVFSPEQKAKKIAARLFISHPDGTQWDSAHDTVLIRNRKQDEWGPEIAVNGIRPAWLADDVPLLGQDAERPYTDDYPGWRLNAGMVSWHTVATIRLPVDHFAYRAIEAGYEPWGGGDTGPADYDPAGGVLFRSGRKDVGVDWRWTHEGHRHDIIGYRKNVVVPDTPAAINWAEPLEAYHTDGQVQPVTFVQNDGTDLPINIAPILKDSVGDASWFREDGSRDSGGWRIRNVIAVPPTVRVPVLTLADCAAAHQAWREDDSDDDTAVFYARHWGLLAPEPTALDRFMAANPQADRATAELALDWQA